jgi:dienelactone hydrolase
MRSKPSGRKRVVVIVHEVRGVTENLVVLASFLTSEGFSVVLPSLYSDGFVGSDEQASYRKFYSEVGIERASMAIGEIIKENVGAKISLLGFSVGATVAWLLSGSGKIDSAIGFYGSRIRNHLDIQPAADVDLYFCRERGFDVEETIGALNAKRNVSAALIPGEHGFYSTSPFASPEIERANRLILTSLKR